MEALVEVEVEVEVTTGRGLLTMSEHAGRGDEPQPGSAAIGALP